jgi:hypothetical protein
MYDADKTVRPLTSYNTKNSNRGGTVLNPNKFRMDTLFHPAAPQTLQGYAYFRPQAKKER